jgi:uncharacterized protein YjbI with pentapeptide repeats
MLKAKIYSLEEIHNAAHLSCEASFYTNKETSFIVSELENSTSRSVQVTNNPSILSSHTSMVLLKEYSASKARYTLKTAYYDYPTLLPLLASVSQWVNEHTTTDYSTHMRLGLAFNNTILETLSQISCMNTRKLLLRVNENYIYENFPLFRNSPLGISVKKLLPINNFIKPENILEGFNSASFSINSGDKYSIDFSKSPHGILFFNYIGGKDYCSDFSKIKNVCEYLISDTYNVLNENDYTKQETSTMLSLTENYRKYNKLYNDPNAFVKEFKDITISIDLRKNEELTKTYWSALRDPLFKLINECEFKKGFFNLDTEKGTIQIKDAKLSSCDYKGLELFNVETSGVFERCDLYNCTVSKGNFSKCRLHHGNKISESIIENSYMGGGTLTKCYVKNNEEVIEANIKECVIVYGLLSSRARLDKDSVVIENPGLGLASHKTPMAPPAKGIEVSDKTGIEYLRYLDSKLNKTKIRYS